MFFFPFVTVMGIYAVESILIYIIVPFCIYLVYLYFNPVLKDCSFCEDDGPFHKCKPNTGATSEWCADFKQSDDLLLGLGKRYILMYRHLFEMFLYLTISYFRVVPYYYKVLFFLYRWRPGMGMLVALLRLVNLKPCGFKIGKLKIDPCNVINKIFDAISSIINGGMSKLLEEITMAIVEQIGKGLRRILSVVFKAFGHLFRVMKVLFTVVTNGLKKITNGIGNVFSIIFDLQIMAVFRSIFIMVVGILAPGVAASFIAGSTLFLVVFAIPLGGFIGAIHLLIYTVLMLINFMYNVFDLDIRDSTIVRMLETIL